MKLNNKGWGMTHLIIGVCIIVIFLLVAAFFTLRLNKWLDDNGITSSNSTTTSTNKTLDTTAKNYYVTKTTEMINATNKYLQDEDIALDRNTTIEIQLDILVNHEYLEDIKDYYTNKSCDGYVLTYLDSSYIKEINAYIKCDNYTTEGYAK